MKTPPFDNFEIEVPSSSDGIDHNELVLKRLTQVPGHAQQNDDSISSELSIDLLSKDRSEDNDDPKLQSLGSSSGLCRWNPDDSDYSLNVLLAPQRTLIEDENENDELETTTVNASSTTEAASSDSLCPSSTHSLFGSDYSLNRARLRVHPNKRNGKKMLDTSSHHSTVSVDSLNTAFSVRSNTNMSLPENIEVSEQQQPHMSNPKAGRNLSVRFYPRVRIQRVPPRNKIPAEQMEAVWYSRREFQIIRKECFKTIRLMKDDEDATNEDFPLYDEDGEELCRRGLEYKTPKAYKRRQKQKKDVRMVVFDELDFQEEQGMDDPLWLAKLSRDQSKACVEAAIETAREDERQAKQYYLGYH
ncbi:hypothetical protein IV203_016132 [Nitzschia inconspicua]|uniref:Uncharacterized protein n=1 Tax=Nitzschia inconspicua TaxID=303405 RepID=A0A9K3PH29_9STRA|nr:hypothetical protein IV203_016132 [Nitzschia inconspicua]